VEDCVISETLQFLSCNVKLSLFCCVKAEWEALEICDHEWALDDVDIGLFGSVHHQTDMHKNKLS